MSDFLFTLWEGGGNVPPFAGAARRLIARGHRVRVLGDDAMRDDIETVGATFIPWRFAYNRPDRRPASDRLRDWEATEPGGDFLHLLDRVTIGPAADYATDTVVELCRRPADAVVCWDALFGPMIGAQAAGMPFAVLAPNVPIARIIAAPLAGIGTTPPVTDEERDAAAATAEWIATVVRERLPTLNAARTKFGLGPLDDAWDQVRSADLFLLATSRAFDFPMPALPRGMRYVGPLSDEPEWAQGWESPWPSPEIRPLVLVAMSTQFQNQTAALQAVLDAAACLPARVLVTLGPAIAGASLAVPENAVVLDHASHDAVMEEAAVVVTHCGHGTVMRALAHQRPMLCLPMGRDQNDNAARVVARGAGLQLARDASVDEIRLALQRLLTEPAFARAAADLGTAIAEAEPANAFVEAMEELAGCIRGRSAA